MKGIMKKAGAMLLAAGLGVSMLAGCGASDAPVVVDGTKTVVTINDEAVKMGVLSLLTRFQQAQIYQIYTSYFGATQIFNMTMDEKVPQAARRGPSFLLKTSRCCRKKMAKVPKITPRASLRRVPAILTKKSRKTATHARQGAVSAGDITGCVQFSLNLAYLWVQMLSEKCRTPRCCRHA